MSLFNQALLDLHDELIIDLFAGGGGASSGIEEALGRMVDVAVNHDPTAVSMHRANHPQTLHLQSDVFEVDPRQVTEGRPVGFLWASPDCTFHSKARGGKPIRSKLKRRRALAWVVTRWAGQVRPRVIALENVEEFADWGPLVGPPDNLVPCKKRRGKSFRRWVKSLTDLGYEVEWRELRACDYGAPTIRKRLYLIARCDGQPIVWPEKTHAEPAKAKPLGLKPYRTAAECIDWSIPMLSIFATKEQAKAWGKEHGKPAPVRPLAENTLRRIARGIKRFVLDNPRPYLVSVAHASVGRNGSTRRGETERDIDRPYTTVQCSNDYAVVSPIVAGVGGRAGQSPERPGDAPAGTVTAKADAAVVAPVLIPRYGEREGQEPRCTSVEQPSPVVVPTGNGSSLVAGQLVSYHSEKGDHDVRGGDPTDPIHTVDTQNRHGVVASFLAQYNAGFAEGNSGDGHTVDDPLSTIATKGPYQGVVSAFLDQANNGYENRTGRPVEEPLATILTESRGHHGLVAGTLIEQHGTADAADIEEPLQTISAGGQHHGVVAAHLQQDYGQSVGSAIDDPSRTVTGGGGGHANLVASFMSKFYGTGTGQSPDDPAATVTSHDRLGLVTVLIKNVTYVLVDIAMRMLQPKELYACQGFRRSYVFDRGHDGRPISKTEQVRMVGNSVSPPVAAAITRANVPELIVRKPERVA